MAKITFKNGDEYMVKLNRLAKNLREEVIGPAVYEGGKIITDGIAERLPDIKTDEAWAGESGKKKGPKEVELRAVYNGLGIAPMRNDNGFINVKVGFGGYSDIKTKRWPNGQPIPMLARSIERGTSFMTAQPFVKPTVAALTKKTVEVMGETVDGEIKKIMERTK